MTDQSRSIFSSDSDLASDGSPVPLVDVLQKRRAALISAEASVPTELMFYTHALGETHSPDDLRPMIKGIISGSNFLTTASKDTLITTPSMLEKQVVGISGTLLRLPIPKELAIRRRYTAEKTGHTVRYQPLTLDEESSIQSLGQTPGLLVLINAASRFIGAAIRSSENQEASDEDIADLLLAVVMDAVQARHMEVIKPRYRGESPGMVLHPIANIHTLHTDQYHFLLEKTRALLSEYGDGGRGSIETINARVLLLPLILDAVRRTQGGENGGAPDAS